MTKEKMIACLIALYRLGNRSDSDDKPRSEDWTRPVMAGPGMCAPLDDIMYELLKAAILNYDEYREIYDNL